jgi:catechol 2,3-dioxygenase-like lactoylglutathione lyase family enzyme
MIMLANFKIGFNIPAADMTRARQFYAEKLGLTPVAELPTRLVYECGGSSFALVPSDSAGKAPYSLMTWYVDDLATEMAALRSLDVAFEEYDTPWLKTVNGVANLDGNQLAWFKDSEGNLLALAQLSEPGL